jgi:tetratricopeptide (TPR) repeat protein
MVLSRRGATGASPAQAFRRLLRDDEQECLVTPSNLSSRPAATSAETLYATGTALWGAGRREDAIALLDAALREKPDYPEALCMGGYILRESGKVDAALRFYSQALSLKSDFTVAWANIGKLFFDLRRFTEALEAFDAAVALSPHDADLWNNRAGALRELGRLDDAIAAAREALKRRPDFAEAALNLGNALMKSDRIEEALESYRRASALKPDFALALCGQGLTLRALDRLDEALRAFDAAERLGAVEAISGKGCTYLALGDFERGWEGYEARWIAGKSLSEALGVRYPRWSGRLVRGERVLVMNDHGLGDSIQFFRYLPIMARAGVDAALHCPPKLHRLFSSADVAVRLIDKVADGESFDSQVPISSLPHAFRTRIETIPAPASYLKAEPALVDKWAARIGAEGFRVGIVWQGNPDPEADMARAMPLAAFAPLAALPNVRLIALQKGFGAEQLAAVGDTMTVETLGEDFDAGPDAFVDTAAAMASLDLIVTCDTSVAHLAGALGRPVWVALKKDAEWRWLRDRDDSPWYPSMRLFRQPRRGDWTGAFEAIAAALAPLAAPNARTPAIAIPGAPGELIDKITILEIKARRIADAAKLRNVLHELSLLEELAARKLTLPREIGALREELAAVNTRLWDIENELRACEAAGDFGARFVALARAVYANNDQRAALKKRINRACGSAIVEEKSYG